MKKKCSLGFTLMEVMVVMSILAVGLTPIFQALLGSLNIFGTYSDFLNVAPWADEKIAEARESLMDDGTLSAGETKGQADIRQKSYEWVMSVNPINLDDGLYRIHLVISWKNGQRARNISRVADVLRPIQYQKTTGAIVP